MPTSRHHHSPRALRRLGATLARDQRGSVALEHAVLFPGLLVVVLAALQAALFFHAGTVAQAAAQEGARVAAGENATGAMGQQAAAQFAARGQGTLLAPTASVNRTPTQATATVTGTVITIIPLPVDMTVTKNASLPAERVTG